MNVARPICQNGLAVNPARSSVVMWTKTSLPPPSSPMKPNPIVPCDRTYAFFDLPVAGPTLARAKPLERHGTLLQPANVDVDLFDRRCLVVAPYRRAAVRTMLRLCCGAPIW